MDGNLTAKLQKNTRLFLIASLFALALVFIALSFFYKLANTNVAFYLDYLPDVLDFLIEIVLLASFFISYGVTFYALFRFSRKEVYFTVAFVIFVSVAKYVINMLSDWFTDGIPSSQSTVNTQLLSVGANAALEILQYLLIFFIARAIIDKAAVAYGLRKKQLEKLGDSSFDLRACAFPIKRFYDEKNPLQKSAFFSAVIISGFRVAQRLVYDIVIYGLPTSVEDALWVFASYFADIVIGVIGYLLILLVLLKLDSHELKIRENMQSKE